MFHIMTERGKRLVLPGEYADELRNDPRFSHIKSLEVVGFDLPEIGREIFKC